MECVMVENVLMDFMERKLDKDQIALIAAHLRKCPACKRLHEKMEWMLLRLADLEEDVPFFLKNRLSIFPSGLKNGERSGLVSPNGRRRVFGTVILFSNLFYFTNIYPPANKGIHSLVSHVEESSSARGAESRGSGNPEIF